MSGNAILTSDEFVRMIDQVQVETLREAAAALHEGREGSACNPACHAADQITLRMRADQIEREAGLT